MDGNANPLKGRSRDWGLTLLVLAYGFTISIMGSLTPKLQYAASTFGWNSEILGYWLTLIGVTRAVCLVLVLPVIIQFFNPKPVIQLPAGESTPLLTSTSSTYAVSTQPATPAPQPPHKKDLHSAAFDLGLARVSLVIEIVSYTVMALTPTPVTFTVCSMTAAMGMGFSPAVQSVALEMYARKGGKETGKLFGALSVVQALCSSTLGPAMFGFVYMQTVATYPQTIFFLVVAVLTAALMFLVLVRLPDESSTPIHNQDSGIEV